VLTVGWTRGRGRGGRRCHQRGPNRRCTRRRRLIAAHI
jgi:hypothetical protein